jgi:hypothetical protein
MIVSFEVHTVMKMAGVVCWVVMPCYNPENHLQYMDDSLNETEHFLAFELVVHRACFWLYTVICHTDTFFHKTQKLERIC